MESLQDPQDQEGLALTRNAFLNFLFVEFLRLNLTVLFVETKAEHRTSRAYLLAS